MQPQSGLTVRRDTVELAAVRAKARTFIGRTLGSAPLARRKGGHAVSGGRLLSAAIDRRVEQDRRRDCRGRSRVRSPPAFRTSLPRSCAFRDKRDAMRQERSFLRVAGLRRFGRKAVAASRSERNVGDQRGLCWSLLRGETQALRGRGSAPRDLCPRGALSDGCAARDASAVRDVPAARHPDHRARRRLRPLYARRRPPDAPPALTAYLGGTLELNWDRRGSAPAPAFTGSPWRLKERAPPAHVPWSRSRRAR